MKIVSKISELYDVAHIQYTYKISYYADLIAMVLMNLFGVAMVLAPLIWFGSFIHFFGVSQLKLNVDSLCGVCIFGFMYYGLSAGFFINNKHKISARLIFLSLGFLLIGIITMVMQLFFGFINAHIEFFQNGTSQWVIVFDGIILCSIIILKLSLKNKNKIQNFIDKHFTKFEQ